MPNDNTQTTLDVDAEEDAVRQYRETDPASEEVLYASRPGFWTGIEVTRSRHRLKRLHVDLQKHTLLSHITEGTEWQISQGKQTYRGCVAAGNIELFSAGNHYDFTFSGAEQEDIYLMFAPDFLQGLAAENGAKAAEIELLWQRNLEDSFIHHVLQAFDAELRAGCPGGRLLGDSLGMALGAHVLARYAAVVSRPPARTAGLSSRDLRRLQAYVREHLHADLSVSDMAQSVSLSPFHFSRLFRSAMHVSPYQYVLQERVERAKQLLLKSDITLAEIAQTVGFASQSHLNRHFKRAFGVAPGTLLRSESLRRIGQKDSTNLEDG